jgi:replicative DNA helicase
MSSEWERPWFSGSSSADRATGGGNGKDEPWPPLISIEDPVRPAFPVDELGPPLASVVHATAQATQTPGDLAAIVCLGTISTAVRGRYVVQPRPGWTETLVLFLLVLLESGNRKSAVFTLLTRPLVAYERDRARSDRQELARWESRRRTQEKDLAKLEAADEAKTPDARHQADDLAMELAADRKPAITRLIVDDVTAEKLSRDLQEQGGALGIMSAEAAIFGNLGGRYNGGIPSLDVLLKGHAGDPIRVDRLGREGEFIANPTLTVCVCAQPTIAEELRDFPGFRGKGAAARFLSSFPASPLGYRNTTPEPIPEGLSAQWDGLVSRILALEASTQSDADGNRRPHVLTFSRDAEGALATFQSTVEVQLRPDGNLSELKDWGGKLPGAVVRIAGLLHIAQHASNRPQAHPISSETVGRAIAIAEYFTHHAREFFTRLSGKDHLGDARDVLAAIDRLAGDGHEVSRSALLQALRGQRRFATTAHLTDPLNVLQDFGYLRLEERPGNAINPETGKAVGGRPPVWIVLRPARRAPKKPNNPPDEPRGEVIRVFRGSVRGTETAEERNDDHDDPAAAADENDRWEAF